MENSGWRRGRLVGSVCYGGPARRFQGHSTLVERLSGASPILAEGPGTNNGAEAVIHRLRRRESCVFHTIHNFGTFFGKAARADGKGEPGRIWQPATHFQGVNDAPAVNRWVLSR